MEHILSRQWITRLVSYYHNSYLSYFLMYNFYYLSWALFSSLISIYLLNRGLTPGEVSLVVSASFLASMIFQPVIGIFSDRYPVKRVNSALFILAALGGIYFINASHFWEYIIGYSFVLTLINGSNPIMERVATASPYAYGKIRIWGTIGYALGSQLAGLIYDFISPSAVFKVFILTMVLCVVGLWGTEPNLQNQEVKHHEKEKGVIRTLLTNQKYLYYLVLSALLYGITNTVNTFTPSYFQSLGLSVSVVSVILSLAVICEAPVVLLSNRFMDKISNKKLLLGAFILFTTLYLVYACNLWLPLQVAATLMIKHPVGMLFIMINLKVVNTLVPIKYQMTALALVQTIRNLSSMLFQNVAGQILNIMSYQYLFWGVVILLLIGVGAVFMFKIPSGNDQKLFH